MLLRNLAALIAIIIGTVTLNPANALDNNTEILKNVTIEKYTGQPPYDSGIGHFIVGMRAKDKNGEQFDFIITYFGKGQFFPKIGTVCDIEYKYSDIYDNMKHVRYALTYGDYIIDPKSRKNLGARPPCGCTELPADAGETAGRTSTCTGEQLGAQAASDWTTDAAGQLHMK